jgi:hypothetical protein
LRAQSFQAWLGGKLLFISSRLAINLHWMLERFSSADDSEQHKDDGNHQENVDEAIYRVRRNQSQQPQENQDDGDGV